MRVTRRRLLAGAPIVASAPLAAMALTDAYGSDTHTMDGHLMSAADMAGMHASMIGDAVPAPDGPDLILEPPAGHEPGPWRGGRRPCPARRSASPRGSGCACGS